MKKSAINKHYLFIKVSPKHKNIEFVFFFGDTLTVLFTKSNFIMVTAAGTKYGLQN